LSVTNGLPHGCDLSNCQLLMAYLVVMILIIVSY
jgi:hypothetical protein